MEEKKYEFNGKVEISTEEYRDLIRDGVKAEQQADDYRSKYWSEQNKVKDLEEKVSVLNKSISHYQKFVNSKEDITLEYKMYLRQLGEDE